MTEKKPPEVDDAEVDRIIAALESFAPTQETARSGMTPEARADVAYGFALGYAKFHGSTSAWAKELARRVRKRILWVK
jgi:hypothetical protein